MTEVVLSDFMAIRHKAMDINHGRCGQATAHLMSSKAALIFVILLVTTYVLLQYENNVSHDIAVYCFPSVVEVYSNVEDEASRPPKSF